MNPTSQLYYKIFGKSFKEDWSSKKGSPTLVLEWDVYQAHMDMILFTTNCYTNILLLHCVPQYF